MCCYNFVGCSFSKSAKSGRKSRCSENENNLETKRFFSLSSAHSLKVGKAELNEAFLLALRQFPRHFYKLTFSVGVFFAATAAAAARRISSRVLWLPLPRLDSVLPHGQGPVHPVEFVVQSAGVANGLAVVVPSPEGGGRRAAVGAAKADAPG